MSVAWEASRRSIKTVANRRQSPCTFTDRVRVEDKVRVRTKSIRHDYGITEQTFTFDETANAKGIRTPSIMN